MASGDEPDSPISLSRFNIKPIPPRVQDTIFGKLRAFNTFTALEWVYLASSLIALTLSVGITVQRLTVEKPSENDFTFSILLLYTIVFCYYYVIHSIFTERWDELMVFVVCNIIVMVYCIDNFVAGIVSREQSQPIIKVVRLAVVCVVCPFLIIAGIIQSVKYCRSNNLIFNTVGAASSLQNACRMFYMCNSLLTFDLQLQISMLILVMGKGVVSMTSTQKIILASGIPISVLFVLIGYLGLRLENKILMGIFYVLGLFEPAYVIYKFYYTARYESEKDATYDSTFACGYFALVIWVLLIVSSAYYVIFYFGKGLRQKIFGENPSNTNIPAGTSTQNVVTQETPADP